MAEDWRISGKVLIQNDTKNIRRQECWMGPVSRPSYDQACRVYKSFADQVAQMHDVIHVELSISKYSTSADTVINEELSPSHEKTFQASIGTDTTKL